ncbi:MAG: hypothetical protein M1823_004515 [Watsoniomyces obsoletus]|nr:MAG: hypothetical protein M1823_004515 [Watsoniomyces obsoletus]
MAKKGAAMVDDKKMKSKKAAKQQPMPLPAVVENVNRKKTSKKSKKAPPPPPVESSDSSDSDSDADTSSGDDSDVSMTSDTPKKAPKNAKEGVALPATNGHAAAADDTSDSSLSSSDESEDEVKIPKKGAAKSDSKPISAPARVAQGAPSSSEEDDSSDGDSDSDSGEEAPPAKPKAKANGAHVNGNAKTDDVKPVTKKEQDSDDDSDDSSEADSDEGSSDSSSEDDEDVKTQKPAVSKKRGADAVDQAPAKKIKSDAEGASDGASQTLHVKNLSWNVDEEWLSREFEGFGELSGVRIITDKNTGRSRGYGYIDFASPASAAAALKAMNQAEVDGRTLSVDFATPRGESNGNERADPSGRARTYGDTTSPESDTLFVANISFEANEDILAEEFGQCGSILQVRLPTDPESGNMRGFGYVQFSSVEEAKTAIETLNGKNICGRQIRLDFSTPRTQNSGGSPRGARGGGRGGFGDRGGRGGFGDRGGRGGRGRGGFGDRGGRGGARGGGRGNSTNRGGFGDFRGQKKTFA